MHPARETLYTHLIDARSTIGYKLKGSMGFRSRVLRGLGCKELGLRA